MNRQDLQNDELAIGEGDCLALYRRMKLIRAFGDKTDEMLRLGKIVGRRRIYAGEEAVSVGAISAMSREDCVVSTYNKFGHRLAADEDVSALMADLVGVKQDTATAGGGRKYFIEAPASGLAIAAGLAMSFQYQAQAAAVCCLFGDEALSHGAFHETLNLASIQNLPLVFVCENNFYGMGTFIDNTVCQEELYRLAGGYKIEGVRVDGMDVLEVYAATQKAALRARTGDGPSLIEAVTYRYRRSTFLDAADYDSRRDEPIWRERDPIRNFRARLIREKRGAESKLDQIDHEVEAAIADALRFVQKD
jgi:TPP-dependent pyruvate/acetoin dehydrogenase alpha subunit